MRIAVDLMGGDRPPEELFEGIVQAAAALPPPCSLLGIATPAVIAQVKARAPQGVEFYPVPEAITMVDDPLKAIRRKKKSSILVGMRLLKRQAAQALVSVGNTGALVSGAALILKTLPGVKRPALLAFLPTAKGISAILDVGGNVSCRSQHLVQFAHIGSIYIRCLLGIDSPTVGLLNIGIESKKGTALLQETYRLLMEQSCAFVASGIQPKFHFKGNIEGKDVFKGVIDLLVTDGFTGNVFLKTTEGVAEFIFETIKQSKGDDHAFWFDEIRRKFNYAEYPGALVCGVNHIVIKCHGHSSPAALANGILGAAELLQKNVLSSVSALAGSWSTL